MARRATAINLERGKAANVLLLDAGDILFGQDLADQTNGRVVVEAMNLMKYDATGIGLVDLENGTQTLYDRAKDARFPFLSANIIDPATAKPIGKPYVIVTVGGRKIALVGLSSIEQYSYLVPGLKLTEKDPIATAREIIDQVKPETNVVIVLSTLGIDKETELATNVPGITAIVGGGSGSRLPDLTTVGENGTLILRTMGDGEELGRWQMTIDAQGRAKNARGQLLALLNDAYSEDGDMLKLLASFPAP